jgi:ABC-type multidrug transport system ATPase subunit
VNVCLRVAGLTKHYGALRAVDNVSFEVRRGEVLGVIGPNGSGKTTLFECLGGVLPLDSGRIEFGPDTGPHSLFYLPDGIAPWPSQTVRWALDYISGLFGAHAGARDATTELLQLSPLLLKRIGQLSKGQRKRVLLALGLLTPRSILLADEPFDGLDLRQTRDVADVLRRAARAGRTLVLSIHQVADAARLCDRFVLLSNGTVRGEGTLDGLIALAAGRRAQPVSGLEDAFLALT